MNNVLMRFSILTLVLAVAAIGPAAATSGSGLLYGSDGYNANTLIIDPATGATVVLGPANVSSTPALAMDPTTGILYGGEGAGNPNLHIVNQSDGSWSLVAPPLPPACGNTNLGYASISDMDFHPDGTLYAAVNSVGTAGTGGDHLVTLDKQTGLATFVGAFGSCWTTPSPCRTLSNGSCSMDGISGLAFDPDGNLWAARNKGGPLGLYQVDIATGAATFHAPLLDAEGNPPAGGVVSLRFGCDGTLYGGTTRTNNQSLDGGLLVIIDPQTGLFTPVGAESTTGGTGLGALAFSGGCECDPDTRGQGYWNRQCLGAGLLQPGRQGRGPQEPMEEDFDKIQTDVSQALGNTIAEFRACEDGIDATPASDPCERAKKEYTSVLFNLESDRLQGSCAVDTSEDGSGATDVSSMVTAMAALINSGEESNCNLAKESAEIINDGAIFAESRTVAAPRAEASTAQPAAARITGRSAGPAPRVSENTEASTIATPDSPAVLVGAPAVVQAPEALPERQEPAAQFGQEDDLADIHRHLAVLGNPAAPERATLVSVDQLLTTLSGGYDLDLRLQVAEALVSRIDNSLSSLLVAHLHHMRMEAQELDLPGVVKDLEALLARLLPTEAAG